MKTKTQLLDLALRSLRATIAVLVSFAAMTLLTSSDLYAGVGTVYGYVKNKNTGKAIAGAKVCLEGRLTACVRSYPNGAYLADNDAGFGYTLTISASGYHKKTIRGVEFRNFEFKQINVELLPRRVEKRPPPEKKLPRRPAPKKKLPPETRLPQKPPPEKKLPRRPAPKKKLPPETRLPQKPPPEKKLPQRPPRVELHQ